MCQISDKTDNFDFLAQIWPKRKLGFEIQKSKVGIRISNLEIPCECLGANLPKIDFVVEISKSKSGFGISILEILCAPIFRQNGQL